jgi:hypothetical protein
MADRRTSTADLSDLQVYKKENLFINYYKPLGQILLEHKKISEEQLDNALTMHWKRGIILGEIFKDLGYVTPADVEEALKFQKEVLEKSVT